MNSNEIKKNSVIKDFQNYIGTQLLLEISDHRFKVCFSECLSLLRKVQKKKKVKKKTQLPI